MKHNITPELLETFREAVINGNFSEVKAGLMMGIHPDAAPPVIEWKGNYQDTDKMVQLLKSALED